MIIDTTYDFCYHLENVISLAGKRSLLRKSQHQKPKRKLKICEPSLHQKSPLK
jgi:hypothetical protein